MKKELQRRQSPPCDFGSRTETVPEPAAETAAPTIRAVVANQQASVTKRRRARS